MATLSRALLATTLLALGACSANAGGDPPPSKELPPMKRVPETPSSRSALPGEAVPVEQVPLALREAVMKDAAKSTNGSPSMQAARKVTWNDGSMGCPQPGMMYTQALIPGYLLVVSANGQEMRYHTDERRNFLRCDQALSPRKQRESPREMPVAPPQPSDPVTRPKTPST